MPAIGQNYSKPDGLFQLCDTDVAVTIGAPDQLATALFNCGQIRQIYCNTAGNLALQNLNGAMIVRVVAAGTILYGKFISIGGSGSGSTAAMTLVASI